MFVNAQSIMNQELYELSVQITYLHTRIILFSIRCWLINVFSNKPIGFLITAIQGQTRKNKK